jgi:hypothetical protein
MARSRLTALAFAALLVLPSLVLAAGTESTPLKAFPDNVSIVVRLKNPQQTVKKVADLADAIQPGLGGMVRGGALGQSGAPGAIGPMISNPDLAGVDTSKDWWLGIFLASDQEPALVFAIPAKDAAAMEKALGDEVNFFKHESWGIYGDQKDVVDRVQACAKGTGKSVATVVDKTSTALFDKGDLSAFVNIRALKNSFQDQLDLGKQQLDNPPDIPEDAVPGIDADKLQKMLVNIGKSLLQAANDSDQCAMALMVSNEGLRIEDTLQVASSSPTAKFLKASPGSEQKILAELPSGFPLYVGVLGDFQELANFGVDLIASIASDKDKDKVTQAADQLKKVKYKGMALAMRVDSKEEGALDSITVIETADTKTLQSATRQLMKNLGTIELGGTKSTYVMKEDAEKYGSNSADVLTVKQDVDNPLAGQVIEKMYGPEGMTTRTVYLKDRVVQTMGGGKDLMTQALAALQGGAAGPSKTATTKKTAGSETAQGGLQTTRKMLDDKPNIVLMVDIAGFVASGAEAARDSAPIPVDTETLKKIAGKPSYIGFSLQCSADSLHTTTVIPVAQMKAIAQMVGVVLPAVGFGGGR